jgi:hypothetical protein
MSWSFITRQNYLVKEDQVGRVCSTDGEWECLQGFGGNARRKEITKNT